MAPSDLALLLAGQGIRGEDDEEDQLGLARSPVAFTPRDTPRTVTGQMNRNAVVLPPNDPGMSVTPQRNPMRDQVRANNSTPTPPGSASGISDDNAVPPVTATPGPSAGFSPLPTAPKYIGPDMAVRRGYEQTLQKDLQPINPNDPSVKAKWYERLLGSLAGGLVAYKDPQAGMDIERNVIGRRYNRAEEMRQKRVTADQSQLQQFDTDTSQAEKDYGNKMKQFNAELGTSKEERARANESSLAQERASKAAKYENAVDPNTIRLDEKTGKFMGRTYGNPDGPEVETAAPKGYKSDTPLPDSYEKAVVAYHLEKDPERKKALKDAVDQLERTENKRFNYKPDGGKGSPAQDLKREQELNKLDAFRQKKLDELENGDPKGTHIGYLQTRKQIENGTGMGPDKRPNKTRSPEERQKAIDALDEAHRQNKQTIENQYASGVKTLGVDYKPVIYNKDGSTTTEGEAAPSSPKAGSSSEAPPKGMFVKGEGVIHQFRNPRTNQVEPWVLKNGVPQLVQDQGKAAGR